MNAGQFKMSMGVTFVAVIGINVGAGVIPAAAGGLWVPMAAAILLSLGLAATCIHVLAAQFTQMALKYDRFKGALDGIATNVTIAAKDFNEVSLPVAVIHSGKCAVKHVHTLS